MKKLLLALLLLFCPISSSFAAEITGVGNFSHIVADLERSIIFYKDVLGLEPNALPVPFSDNPIIMQLGNTPGAQSRIATFNIPGSEMGVELIEYTDIRRLPIQTRFQDPGAALIQLQVKDMGAILARLGDSDGSIWTPSGEPVSLGATGRIIFLKDPDGFFVEIIENNPASAASFDNVYGGNFELIINDTEQTAAFYRDGMGFDPQVSEGFDDTPMLSNTVNAPGGAFRRTSLTISGTELNMAFLEFRGVTRKAMNSKIQDPGTAILQVFTDDVVAMANQLVAAGATYITAGGKPVEIGGNAIAIVRDPNNLFIELLPEPN